MSPPTFIDMSLLHLVSKLHSKELAEKRLRKWNLIGQRTCNYS